MRRLAALVGAAILCALSTHAWAQAEAQLLPQAASPPAEAVPLIVPLAPYQSGAEPVSPNETHPGLKEAASEVALALTNYDPGDPPPEVAGAGDELFVPDAWSRGQVIYPQLGGLGPTRASVMVVTQQMIGHGEDTLLFVRTLDVRMRIENGVWTFDFLASVGGTTVVPPSGLSAEALAVLNDPRIEMPDSARWDIFEGKVSHRLLRIMARLAELTPYGVTTLSQGHPYEVFGTDRQSDHSRGLAVDIYRIGGRLVIDDRAQGSQTYEIVRWLYEQPEIRQIGSPWALDGYGGRSFADALHQDHLHIAVYP